MLLKLIRDQKPMACVVVFDSKKASFRKEIDSRYKAQRPPPPEDLSGQIEAVRKLCEAAHLPILQEEGFEADDWIASFVKSYSKSDKIVIVSTDKDLMALVSERVVLFDSFKDRILGIAEVKEKFGVGPHQICDFLSLTGDSSDNIPGLSGIGPKTAAKWLQDFGTLDQILANRHSLPANVQAKIENELAELELSRKLVCLKDDLKIPEFATFELRLPMPPSLKEFLLDWDCKRALENYIELFRDGDLPPQLGPVKSVALKLVEDAAHLQRLKDEMKDGTAVAIDIETNSFNRFKSTIVGLSFAFSEKEAFYLPWRHGQTSPSLIEARDFSQWLLERASVRKICHNLKFEQEVFFREGLKLLGPCDDTMLQAYLLRSDLRSYSLAALSQAFLTQTKGDLEALLKGSENFADIPLGEAADYAAKDAQLTFQLDRLLRDSLKVEGSEWLYQHIEIPLVSVIGSMERLGIAVDAPYLNKLSSEFHAQMKIVEAEIYRLAGENFNIQSPKQLQLILFDKLKLSAKKKTKTGFSTDESVLQELALEHPLPSEILKFRSLAKLTSTYVDVLPSLVESDGRIHTHYHQTGTVTGRLSSSNPNLQNIPTRSEEGHKIRQAFVASSGHCLTSADYSQVELRIFAHMSQDEKLIAAFRSGRDIHSETARVIFGSEAREFRERSKAINYGIVYGLSAYGLSQQLRISVKEAADFVEAYFGAFPRLKPFMDSLKEKTRKLGYAETLFHRRRLLPDILSQNVTLRNLAERMSINAPVQGTAADIMKWAMVRLDSRIRQENLKTRILLQVHDELVLEVPESEQNIIGEILQKEMTDLSGSPLQDFSVPLVVDIEKGPHWGAL